MTGRGAALRPVAVTGWLRVDLGHRTRHGTWVRHPAADYACACGWHAEAAGDQVPHFTATASPRHRAVCPHHRKD